MHLEKENYTIFDITVEDREHFVTKSEGAAHPP